MCLMDYKLSSQTGSNEQTVTVGATSQPVIPANNKRVGLIFLHPLAGRVTISLKPTAVDGQGWVLQNQEVPVCLTLAQHGDVVRKAFSGIADAGGRTFTYWEINAEFEWEGKS